MAKDNARILISPHSFAEWRLPRSLLSIVPAVVTQNKDEAALILTSAVDTREESGGSKVARGLFLYCAGISGTQTATVQLVNSFSLEVEWAYNVKKGNASAYPSTAEAIAKHLKEFLEKHPQHPRIEPIPPPPPVSQ